MVSSAVIVVVAGVVVVVAVVATTVLAGVAAALVVGAAVAMVSCAPVITWVPDTTKNRNNPKYSIYRKRFLSASPSHGQHAEQF